MFSTTSDETCNTNHHREVSLVFYWQLLSGNCLKIDFRDSALVQDLFGCPVSPGCSFLFSFAGQVAPEICVVSGEFFTGIEYWPVRPAIFCLAKTAGSGCQDAGPKRSSWGGAGGLARPWARLYVHHFARRGLNLGMALVQTWRLSTDVTPQVVIVMTMVTWGFEGGKQWCI